jgi:exopolyphosphatase/guanosine-5'-triphosphate,3'-diphosphate pyrophosphatase
MKKTTFLAVLILILPFLSHSVNASNVDPLSSKNRCQVNRALFDIGSGATKFQFVQVDVCKQKILQVYFKKDVSVPYQESLNLSHDGNFSPEVIQAGFETLKSFKAEAESVATIDEAFGLATAAFRKAKNGQAVLEKLEQELGIKIDVISQEMEAILGLKSARYSEKDPTHKHILVWDIGGGSQQIITDMHPDGLVYVGGGMGAETFEKTLIELIKNEDSSQVESPNPIGPDNVQPAIQLAHTLISFPAKNFLRIFQYRQKHDPKIIGIGSVHKSILRLVNPGKNSYKKSDLLHTAIKNSAMNDAQLIQTGIRPEFVDHEVSNMLFVYAVMDTFNIDEVHVLNANPIDALIIEGQKLLESDMDKLHKNKESQKQLY